MRLNRNRKLDRVLTPIYTSTVNIQEQEICCQLQIGKLGNVSLTSLPIQGLVEEKSLAIYMAEKICFCERNFNGNKKTKQSTKLNPTCVPSLLHPPLKPY